jgi:hemerythrin superfamily protein
VANFKLKIQAHKQRTKQLRKRYNISRLKDDKKIQELFKLELTNRFQILTDMERVENEYIYEKWRKIRTTFTEASEKVLGFKEKNKKRLDDSTDLGKDQGKKKD